MAAALLTPVIHLGGTRPLETGASALLALVGLGGWRLIRAGYRRYVPHAVVLTVLAVAVITAIDFGSVRSSAVVLFVAAVAGAGIFMSRRALALVVVLCAGALGALVVAEVRGWIGPADFAVGARNWGLQVLTLVVVAAMVYVSRTRTEQVSARLDQELQRRIATELARDQHRERFERIFHTSPSPMLAQSARTGEILDVNPAFERCYRYPREALLGKSDELLWADMDERKAYTRKLFEHRHVMDQRCKAVRADGTTFDAQISSEMGNDVQDKLIITTISDVSAQTEAMEKLRRSEERFSKAFNFSPLQMVITRLSDGRFMEVNDVYERIQGLPPVELKGKTTVEAGAWLRAEDRNRFVQLLLEKGHIDNYETRLRHKNGSLVDARLWAVLIELEGNPCILTCTVDVTQEKRREALLLDVARGVAGKTGEDFFPALTRHMAVSLEADMIIMGETLPDGRVRAISVWRDGVHARNFTFATPNTPCGQALVETGLCVFAGDLPAKFPPDSPLLEAGYEAYVGQSLRDEDGTPIGVLNAMWKHTITPTPEMRALMSIFSSRANAELLRLRRDREIQRLNQTLEQRVQERTDDLLKLNHELDTFAYSVSHDLKTPLRSIDGFTQILRERLGDRIGEEEEALFARVLASTRRMSTLISDMLALARVSQARLALEPVDLSALAHRILDAELELQPRRRVLRRIQSGLVVTCDAQLVRLALENLLGNALKYSREQPETHIAFGQREGEPGSLPWLFVQDNGVGFNMAYADKLFQPFQRLHPGSAFEGTGIGLATVRRIIERHGGSIRGSSTPGQGATFEFRLGPESSSTRRSR
jgi:PAS domain S-box-containing protein